MLTGKAKEEFEKWFNSVDMEIYLDVQDSIDGSYNKRFELSEYFKELCFSMQYGVYVDFFESKGIYIMMFSEAYKNGVNILYQVFEYDNTTHDCWSKNSSPCYGDNGEYTTPLAREEAIKKANLIYNKL